jgi:hypothetical protein
MGPGSNPSPIAAVGRAGAADGRYPAVNLGHSRYLDPQVSGGLVGLARAAGGAEVPLQRRGQAVPWQTRARTATEHKCLTTTRPTEHAEVLMWFPGL